MKIPILTLLLSLAVPVAVITSGEPAKNASRVVNLKAPDGATLKASYFAAAKPGPGVLLYHQSNRTRQSWDDVAAQLAAVGIHVLTVDSRAHGESGGKSTTKPTAPSTGKLGGRAIWMPRFNT